MTDQMPKHGPVKVKKISNTAFGPYFAGWEVDSGYWAMMPSAQSKTHLRDQAEAIAICQADYEARVLALLEGVE